MNIVDKCTRTVVEEEEVAQYPTEFLNSLDISGMPPPHLPFLKIGVLIVILRNIDSSKTMERNEIGD